MATITVHMIGNAHLDPVWLWRRWDGVDTALATARSACDRMDEYPDFVFSCAGSWFYRQIEEIDPALFERVRGRVAEGRWRLVGGMVVQPDCNLPSPESFRRQLKIGQDYYDTRFGMVSGVGYNVDSFGHGPYLPRFLREAGICSYVFLRPGPHEKTLPANVFRWRSPDGAEVIAFRICGGYGFWGNDLKEHIRNSLAGIPGGLEHTMCFYGVGDHGGGPTKAQIEWIRQNAGALDGARLVFSHPLAFFDAIAGDADRLPVVEGDLQHHAIGCYSVERRIKVAMRRAEARLEQAAQTLAAFPENAPAGLEETLDRAWETVAFNQFHDVFCGTSIDLASRQAAGELVNAEAQAEDAMTLLTRRATRPLARPGTFKLVAFNASALPFDGLLEYGHFFEMGPATGQVVLEDQGGQQVPAQLVEPAAKVNFFPQALFEASLGPREMKTWLIRRDVPPPVERKAAARATSRKVFNGHVDARGTREGFTVGDWPASFEVFEDPTDTWAHSAVCRFSGERAGAFGWRGHWDVYERGPIRAAARRMAAFGDSRLWCRLLVERGKPFVRLRLSVVWSEKRRILQLGFQPPAPLTRRVDLVSGGPVERPLDGQEYPLYGGLMLAAGQATLALLSPEVFSVSVAPDACRLTLLRSPYMAHHDPMSADQRLDAPVADQGSHDFEILLWPGCGTDTAAPVRLVRQMSVPPLVWDLTG
jgi:alpha-mannosidase